MIIDVLRYIDITSELGQRDGWVHSDGASSEVHVCVDVTCEVLTSNLPGDLHEELFKVAMMLVYPPLLHH